MRPLFTIHAGEYLVGSHIEDKLKNFNVWVPSKDTGVDLLVTDLINRKTVSLQVKYSKDFKVTHLEDSLQRGLKSCGWWTLNRDKMKYSNADFWIFVLYNFNQKDIQYVIIDEAELAGKFYAIVRKAGFPSEEAESLRPNSMLTKLWQNRTTTWEEIYRNETVRIYGRVK